MSTCRKNIVVVEPTGCSHYIFNRKIIEILYKSKWEVSYVGIMSEEDLGQKKNINYKVIKDNKRKFITIYKYLKESKSKKIIFLSYELRSIPWLIFLKIMMPTRKLYAVEHNTIPDDKSSILKKAAFIISNLICKKIALSRRVKEYIKKRFKKKAYFLPHPIELTEMESSTQYIFSPSGTTTDAENELLLKVMRNYGSPIYIKSNTFKYDGLDKSVIVSKWFENYDEIMKKSKIVFIGAKGFKYRESGPVYEGLAGRKIVLMNDSGLYRELNECGYDVNLINIDTKPNKPDSEKHKKFINAHADHAVENSLMEILK